MSKIKSALGIESLSVQECQTMIAGSMTAIIENKEYFYNSHVGAQYSHLTVEGQEMLVRSMNALLPLLAHAKERELNERAKSITWSALQEDVSDK